MHFAVHSIVLHMIMPSMKTIEDTRQKGPKYHIILS